MNAKSLGLTVLACALIGIAVMQYKASQKPEGEAAQTGSVKAPVQKMAQNGQRNALKDGVYESTGAYQSPGGPEKLGVKLEIKNNTVVTADVTVFVTNDKTEKFQNLFKESYSEQVIGKDIRTLKLVKVSASSLTPIGFNDAVAKIVKQAQG